MTTKIVCMKKELEKYLCFCIPVKSLLLPLKSALYPIEVVFNKLFEIVDDEISDDATI